MTTFELAQLIADKMPFKEKGQHPATRVFQAIRIQINNELGDLIQVLDVMPKMLSQNGRMVVISFHSLEDRIVKTWMNDSQSAGQLEIITSKPIEPCSNEISRNPRSRSAKLRLAKRIA